jgi:hypothetical protein
MVDLSAITQSQEATSIAVLGSISLAWLIVLIVEIICVPLLITLLVFYLCPGRCACVYAGGSKEQDASAVGALGTVDFDDPA